MESSKHLTSYLRHCSLEWADRPFLPLSKDLFEAANLLPPTIETLHMSLLQWPSHPAFTPNLSSLITSIAVDLQLLGAVNDEGDNQEAQKRFIALYSLPRLKTLTTHGMFNWDVLVKPNNQTHRIDRINTSSVSHLTMFSSIPSREVFLELMKWTKQLKSIEILLRCGDIPHPLSSTSFDIPDLVDMSEIVEGLRTQAGSLESILFAGDGIISHKEIDWTSFAALKRLGFPRGNSGRELPLKDYSAVFHSLPFQLEELQVEQPRYQNRSFFIWGTVPHGCGLYEEGNTVRPWVSELVEKKSLGSLALSKILLWPVAYISVPIETLLGGSGVQPLASVCEGVGIEFILGMSMRDTILGESMLVY